MTKAERVSTVIGVVGIILAIAAWQFPISTPPTKSEPLVAPSSLEEPNDFKPPTSITSEQKVSYAPEVAHMPEMPTSGVERQSVVRAVSFKLFLSQVRSFSLDSTQLEYVRKSKHLLSRKLAFSELNQLIDEMSLDLYRIDMVQEFRQGVEPPSERELELFLEKFSLDSYKQEALALLYQ